MAVTPNYSWPVPVATDYVKDGWEAISDLGNAIDTTVATLGSGLTKINSFTLTGSSGQVITGLEAGSRYRILINAYASVNNEYMNMRFRQGASDVTINYFGGTGYTASSGGVGVYYQVNNGSVLSLARMNNSANIDSFVSIDLFINALQNSAKINMQASADSAYAVFGSFFNNDTATVDGVNIYPASGTFTGKITIYKYQD
jgi:hypothetical protein